MTPFLDYSPDSQPHRFRLSLLRPAVLALMLALSLLAFAPRTVTAQGILYPRPDVRIQPFYVRGLRVNTTIHDAVAETTVEQTWVNTSNVEQEGTYLYPLPSGAAPTAFSMTVGDRTLEPKVLSSGEARAIYEDIVRRRRDPALLEYVGRDLVKISVYPIPPNGERKILMRYTQILKPENGLYKYAYPLSTSRFGARPVGSVSINLKLITATPIKNVYSPTHAMSVRKTDEHTASASYEGLGDTSDSDLTLYFSTNGDDVGMSLLTYKSGDRDGYFVLLAAPRVVVPREKILPKQIVFVLDRTGSMAGPKIEQARKSLLFCLNSLHREDRFDVITFSESPDVLLPALAPASEENIGKARKFVENTEASGGTNIDEALRAALKLVQNDNGAQKMIVFLTDGLPTVGETNIGTILQHVHERNKETNGAADVTQNGGLAPRPAAFAAQTRTVGLPVSRNMAPDDIEDTSKRAARGHSAARIFCFGLGYDVNVPFLDRLGEQEKGDSDFIKPQEDVEAKVSAFFAKVSSPILSSVKLAFDNADVYDVYPSQLPDLFKGSQLVITGRFRGERAGTARLSGMANGTQETFKTPAPFGSSDSANGFVPRLWAQRKIGYLIDQLRLANVAGSPGVNPAPAPNKEVVDEIVRLSREYGIITEYTSFLVDDREQRTLGLGGGGFGGTVGLGVVEQEKIRREVLGRADQFGMSGESATDQSGRARSYRAADQVASRYQSANGGVTTLNATPQSLATGLPAPVFAGKPTNGNFGYARREGGGAFANRDAAKDNGVLVQAVGDRAFYRQANALWQDQSYDAKKNSLTKIQAFSDAHFALLRAVPALAAYSSVGDEIIVRVGSRAVQIGKEGKTTLTDTELKQLTGK